MAIEHMNPEKAAEARRKQSEKARNAITDTGRAMDRRKIGECRSRGDAIQSFCCECITSYGLDNGDSVNGRPATVAAAIEHCTTTECHLWPWRLGALRFDDNGDIT